jgi:dolichol-phosphate mannosyltransferase
VDRAVIDAFRRCEEPNVSVLALITWLGFPTAYIEYDKQPRAAGRSGWTLARKVKLVIDSLTAFTDAPIRLCWMAGAVLLALGVLTGLAGLVLLPSLGAGLLILVGALTALSGIHLVALGVVGEYVWRALAAARRRPLYVIEAAADAGASVRMR